MSSVARFHSRRCHTVNPPAIGLACQSDRDDLDPSWFSSDRNGVESPLGSASNFLFTFPDPESLSNNESLPDDDLNGNMLVDEYAEEDNLSPSRSDDLFDQIMGLSHPGPRRRATRRDVKISNPKHLRNWIN